MAQTRSAAQPAEGHVLRPVKRAKYEIRKDPRSSILALSGSAGGLSSIANSYQQYNNMPAGSIASELAELCQHLLEACHTLGLDLVRSIRTKLKLNEMNYPIADCTGDPDNDKKCSVKVHVDPKYRLSKQFLPFCNAMPRLSEKLTDFANKRRWKQYEDYRNLVLALVDEVGRLSGMVPWFKKDKWWDPTEHPLQRKQLGKILVGLADVAIYALRIAANMEIISEVRTYIIQRNTDYGTSQDEGEVDGEFHEQEMHGGT